MGSFAGSNHHSSMVKVSYTCLRALHAAQNMTATVALRTRLCRIDEDSTEKEFGEERTPVGGDLVAGDEEFCIGDWFDLEEVDKHCVTEVDVVGSSLLAGKLTGKQDDVQQPSLEHVSSTGVSYEFLTQKHHEQEDLEWVARITDETVHVFQAPPMLPSANPRFSGHTAQPLLRVNKAARSKRSRGSAKFLPAEMTSLSVLSSDLSSFKKTSPFIRMTADRLREIMHETTRVHCAVVKRKRGRLISKKKAVRSSSVSSGMGGKSKAAGRCCSHCGVRETPQWRTGPEGSKTLCNACGVRYKSGRLLPEYRPACSPTFVLGVHSCSHRKVVEMRREKESVYYTSNGAGTVHPEGSKTHEAKNSSV